MTNNYQSEFDTSTTEIDGVQYTIRLLNTSTAFLTAQELFKLTVPSLGAAVDGLTDQYGEPTTFTAVAFHITKQLGDINVLKIIMQLLDGAAANGQPINFETYFRGKFSLLVKVVEFALKENYGSLFTDMGLRERLRSYIQSLIPQTQEQPKSAG